jgi:hypothetical protein
MSGMATRVSSLPSVEVADPIQSSWNGRFRRRAGGEPGRTPSAMSYHLRRLARLGMVERAVSSPGDDRPWPASWSRAALRLTREEAPRRFGYEAFWILGAQPPAGD